VELVLGLCSVVFTQCTASVHLGVEKRADGLADRTLCSDRDHGLIWLMRWLFLKDRPQESVCLACLRVTSADTSISCFFRGTYTYLDSYSRLLRRGLIGYCLSVLSSRVKQSKKTAGGGGVQTKRRYLSRAQVDVSWPV
jgi:hypothetical protein